MPRHEQTYARVGVVAEVSDRVRLGHRGLAASLTGLHRAIPGAATAGADGVLRVDVSPYRVARFLIHPDARAMPFDAKVVNAHDAAFRVSQQLTYIRRGRELVSIVLGFGRPA